MANRTSRNLAAVLSRFSQGTGVLVITFGLVVLTGWAFRIQEFKQIITGQVAVKANTGACLVFLGLALLLIQVANRKRSTTIASIGLALTASLVGLLSFFEYLYGWDLHIDQVLFKAGMEDAPGSVRPGLMSPVTGIDFFLIGIAIALLASSRRWVPMVQNMLVGVSLFAAMFGILDFVLDPKVTHTHIAPMTALVLFVFSFAVLCARTERGLGALLAKASPGANCRAACCRGRF